MEEHHHRVVTGRRRPIWFAWLTIIALVAAGCGGSTPVASGSPGTAVTPSQVPGDTSAPASGTIAKHETTLDLAADWHIAPAAAENASRASGRTSADLAGYLGPDAPTVAAKLDQQLSDELWKLVDGVPTAGATSTVPNAVLASVRLPRVDVHGLAVPPPGMSLLGPWVAAMTIVEHSLGTETASSKSNHDESQVELGPNTGTVTTDGTVTVTPSGSRLVVDVVTKTTGQATDANGRLIFRINGNGHAHIEVQACPDAKGMAPASMAFTANEEYFVSGEDGRVGQSWQDEDKGDARIFADENADLDHEEFDLATKHATKGGSKAAGAGQSTLTAYSVDATEAGDTIARDGRLTTGGGSYDSHNATKAQVDDAYRFAELLVSAAVSSTAKATEKFWRSGKCIEVTVDPMGGDVGANSTTTVSAKVRHKFESGDLDKSVVATMTGVKSIDPANQKVKPPATFTYTAGPKPKDAGVVTFKSVSNRGIGETTVRFAVGGGYMTESNGQTGLSFKGQKCGGLDGTWKIDGQLKEDPLTTTSTWVATIDGTTLAGTYTFRSVSLLSTGFGDITTTQTGTGQASMVAQDNGSYLMTLAGTRVTSTAVGAGTTQTVTLPIPAIQFTWTPSGTCPA